MSYLSPHTIQPHANVKAWCARPPDAVAAGINEHILNPKPRHVFATFSALAAARNSVLPSDFLPNTCIGAVGVINQLIHVVGTYPPHLGIRISYFTDAKPSELSAVFLFFLNPDFAVVFHYDPQMYLVRRMDSADPHMPPTVKASMEMPLRVFSFSMKILLTMVFCRTISPSVATVQTR